MSFGWLSDPVGARHRTKDAAVARLAAQMRERGATDERIADAKRELRAALAGVTTDTNSASVLVIPTSAEKLWFGGARSKLE